MAVAAARVTLRNLHDVRVVFHGDVDVEVCLPHGRGKRRVRVTLDEAVLQRLAALAQAPASRRQHLAWHYENGRSVPCDTCPPAPGETRRVEDQDG